MAPWLELRAIGKRFGPVRALDDCSLGLARGEILALLGPSGCGKSTLLGVIAGFERPEQGDVLVEGRSVLDLPPHRRNLGVVFQSYALFPHLTVRANIGYGLRARRVPAPEATARIAECLELLQLGGLADRYPAELSGGQRQRVAVARALAPRPDLLLLDEPFSALDRNLREATQLELSLLLRRLGITTILVTHDQREAFALADRVAVMSGGRVVQLGTPEAVYRRPATAFVHDFLGAGTRLPATAQGDGRIASLSGIAFDLPPGAGPFGAEPLTLLLRSEEVGLARAPTAVHAGPPGRVVLATFLGGVERCVVDLEGRQVVADLPPATAGWRAGDAAFLDFSPARCMVVATADA